MILGIPIPSLIAYHQDHLKQVVSQLGESSAAAREELQVAFVHAFRDDLAEVRGLADEVLIAHTARHLVRVAPPLTLALKDPPTGPARFAAGVLLRPSYSIRSGENGFFSVANTDALYRVMRVASASELALVLAAVGVLGDDANAPWFPAAENNVCYYTETDNSRQVFDLLNQPPLLAAQLSGIEPMALQDLGSAKHQGELHALSLLILLHRLRTVDIDAIDPYVDLDRFDPERFLAEHSRPLTFEDLARWPFGELAREMQILVGADSAEELAALNPRRHGGLFPAKQQAQSRIFRRALEAVWAIPSLGSPIVFERDGMSFVRTGFFVAPFEILCDRTERIAEHIEQSHARGNGGSFADFRDFHLATGGFVDVRPSAILTTARTDREDLAGRVVRCRDEADLLAAIETLEPYSFFATCGLAALTARLNALHAELRQAMLELGSASM